MTAAICPRSPCSSSTLTASPPPEKDLPQPIATQRRADPALKAAGERRNQNSRAFAGLCSRHSIAGRRICGERNHERFNCEPLASSKQSRRQWSQQVQRLSALFGQALAGLDCRSLQRGQRGVLERLERAGASISLFARERMARRCRLPRGRALVEAARIVEIGLVAVHDRAIGEIGVASGERGYAALLASACSGHAQRECDGGCERKREQNFEDDSRIHHLRRARRVCFLRGRAVALRPERGAACCGLRRRKAQAISRRRRAKARRTP